MKAILRYPGSKGNIAKWIIDKFPKHHSYLEPYFGSGAVLFKKKPSNIETVNDLNDDVINLFKVIRDNPEELARLITFTPFSREEYNNAFIDKPDDELEKARLFLLKSTQSHGFRLKEKSGWKNDVKGRQSSYAVQMWNELPWRIEQVARRLKEVQIEKSPAVKLINRFNYKNVLVYADPPYLLETRTRKMYDPEMTDEQHVELLETLIDFKGKVILSGYENDMYNEYLKDWYKDSTKATAEKGLKRIETVWTNFRPDGQQLKLF